MFNQITPTVRNLILANVIVYFILSGLPKEVSNIFSFHNPFLPNSPDPLNPLFKLWQIVTHMFMHGGTGHLFSNMFGLFMFGSMLETYFGGKRFLTYYMLCGIGAVLFYAGVNYFQMSQLEVTSAAYAYEVTTPMVGASGAIFGILGAFAFLFPNIEMSLLFVPFPIKAKYFVALYGIYELVQGTVGYSDGIGHWAHIGGLLTGLILLKFFNFRKQKGLL
jgi:membrane associated rhomboid family serine protease